MLKLAVGMTCAPRRFGDAAQYTQKALLSLRRAGFNEHLHLFCEPGKIIVPNSKKFNFGVVQTHDRGHPMGTVLGCFRNWRTGLDWMLANVPAAGYLMLQDDCIWREDGHTQLMVAMADPELFGPHIGFISPYTSKAMVRHAGRPEEAKGWTTACFYNKAFWGALAICMPASSARALSENGRYTGHTHSRKLDVVLGNVFRDMSKSMLVHVPSLCDHIGSYSTLGRHRIKGNQWGRSGYNYRERP